MDLAEVLVILRTARGRLNAIIVHYAQTRGEWELEAYLDDPEISAATIVYIWNELPYVDPRIVESLKRRLEAGTITEEARPWVDDIIFNHG
jgi:hypothetical protein